MTRAVGLAALAVLLALAAPPARAACSLQRMASLDMSIDQAGAVNVPVGVGGKTFNMLIDTGGLLSMLVPRAVESLGPRRDPLYEQSPTMFGGARVAGFVVARDIAIGGLTAPKMSFLVLPEGHLASGVDGIISQDILRAYDDDFDFAGAKFNLFAPNDCAGSSLVYWAPTAPYAEIPFTDHDQGHITLPLELDGKRLLVMLDTGASRTTMRLEAAQAIFGLKPGDLKPVPSNTSNHSYKYAFKTLTFGGVTVENPDIVLMPNSAWGFRFNTGPDLILGMGVLRQLHMYIAYKQHRIFVTQASAH